MLKRRRQNVVNQHPRAAWPFGTDCWFYDPDSDRITQARVRIASAAPGGAAVLEWFDGTFEHTRSMPADTLFDRQADIEIAVAAYRDALRNEFAEAMPDVTALISFAWKNLIARDMPGTDYEAVATFKNRAEELTGLRLEDN